MSEYDHISIFLFHLGLALFLFILTNWLGKHSIKLGYVHLSTFLEREEHPAFNAVFRILTPVVFLMLVSAGLYSVHLDILVPGIFACIIYYILLRAAAVFVLGKARLTNWLKFVIYSCATLFLALLAYKKLILRKKHLLPDLESMGNEIWILIMVFLYMLANNLTGFGNGFKKRKTRYLKYRYQKLEEKFGNIVTQRTNDPSLQALIYAIMIYESFNRPKAVRIVESLLFRLGISKTLGVMQVRTTKLISDEVSVEQGVEKILKDFRDVRKSEGETQDKDSVIMQCIARYNRSSSYMFEVLEIYGFLKSISKHPIIEVKDGLKKSVTSLQKGSSTKSPKRPPKGIRTKTPGLVRSPHARNLALVDVSRFVSGNPVRCPHTGETFIVP